MKLEQSNIKKKLMAAVSMLLVSAIMTVSTTYAWFTLSTAPEISGITTAVGANGSLEIALSPTNGVSADIGTGVGTSASEAGTVVSNTTWGNIIDVSANYGLEDISLSPSQLNVTGDEDNGYTVSSVSILSIPTYGSDGRVASLDATTSTGILDADGNFTIGDGDYGVRAIGVAAGLTDKQIDYRNYKAAVFSDTSAAQTKVANTLSANGATLGSVLIEVQVSGEAGVTLTLEEVQSIGAMIDGLDASLTLAESALKSAVYAYAASAATDDLSDTEYAALIAKLDDASLAEMMDTSNGYIPSADENGNNDFVTAYSAIVAVRESVSAASIAYETLNVDEATADTTYAYADVKTVLTYLFSSSGVTLNGDAVSGVTEMGSLISSVMSSGINIGITPDSGAFGAIANIVGNYSTSVTMETVYLGETYGTMTNVTASMATDATVDPSYLEVTYTAITALGAPSGESDGDAIITDYYGYAIDTFVRTNASGSNLLLQADATQRVYEGSENEETMGSGSTMSFASSDTSSFSTAQVLNLMDAIQITFVDSSSNILGVAKLDIANATEYVVSGSVVGYTATIVLYDYTVSGAGVLTVDTDTELEEQSLIALTANEATQITTIVHLDGNLVENSDVASAGTSMTGTMNLQFSSDTTLVPMVNTDLYDGTSLAADTEDEDGSGDENDPAEETE